jgi:CBS domain-containing protein
MLAELSICPARLETGGANPTTGSAIPTVIAKRVKRNIPEPYHERSKVMKLSTMFIREVVTARPGDSLAKVANLMAQQNVGTVVVAEQDRPVGIVTDRDLALAVCDRRVSPDERVQEVMTCPVSTMKQNEGVYRATQHMMELGVRRLPVVDEVGRLVGLVSLDDLLLLLSRELHNMAEGIRGEMSAT